MFLQAVGGPQTFFGGGGVHQLTEFDPGTIDHRYATAFTSGSKVKTIDQIFQFVIQTGCELEWIVDCSVSE